SFIFVRKVYKSMRIIPFLAIAGVLSLASCNKLLLNLQRKQKTLQQILLLKRQQRHHQRIAGKKQQNQV
ncbi:hypothetical protein QW060_21640, partial [Myroides ceti]